MELRHLRYFVAVAETRHFGRAAQRLHMAQPPLSQAIRQLEADVGAELFARTTRQVNLTRAGEVFYQDAVRILDSVEGTSRRVKRVAEGHQGVLRIGLTGLASYRQLPALARIVERELPDVALEIRTEMLTSAQERGLLDRELDVGLLRPPVREELITCRRVAREPLVLVLPENHRLVGQDSIDLAELRAEHFVMYSEATRSVVNEAVIRSCLAADFYPHCAHEVAETSVLLALVAAGLGVALVPESVRAITLDGVLFRPVRGSESVDLALAWRNDDTSPLLANLLATLEANDLFITSDSSEEHREDHQD